MGAGSARAQEGEGLMRGLIIEPRPLTGISVRSAVICSDCDLIIDGRLRVCPQCGTRISPSMPPVSTWILPMDATDRETLRRTKSLTRRRRAEGRRVA